MSIEKRRDRDRDREAMRRRILDAAKHLFVREGFDNVSMRRIASRIEYSPAALYRYFKNKREILSVLREEGFARLVARQEASRRAYPDPLERLRTGMGRYIRFALDEPDRYRLMFGFDCGQVDMQGMWAASSIRSFRDFQATVAECVDTGRFGEVDVTVLVFALWSQLHGLVHLMESGRVAALTNGGDIDRLVDGIIEFSLRPGSGRGDPAAAGEGGKA